MVMAVMAILLMTIVMATLIAVVMATIIAIVVTIVVVALIRAPILIARILVAIIDRLIAPILMMLGLNHSTKTGGVLLMRLCHAREQKTTGQYCGCKGNVNFHVVLQ